MLLGAAAWVAYGAGFFAFLFILLPIGFAFLALGHGGDADASWAYTEDD